MDDLISRQAAIDMIDAIFPIDPTKSEYAQGIACGAALAKTYIKQLPSAQPERKKGKWTKDSACEFCGFQPWYENDIHTLSYCPNCGADCRGDKNDDSVLG